MAKLAKLTAPRPRRVLDRPRLFARIERAGTPLVWIEAPPGAGKTTLVASWLAERGRRGIWYQLDAGDADVATFFHYLALAARSATRRRLRGLPTFGMERRGAEALFARQFFRELCGAVPAPCVLVIENVHELPPGAPLLDALAAGLEELTGSGSALITSRSPPPAVLARSRAHGTLSVIQPAELAFTLAEARRLAALHRSGLSPAEVAALHARTAGWAAGLVVVLASARHALAEGGSVPAPGELFAYFAVEVFERAEPFTRRVLLETALLPRPTAAAATRLLGTQEAAGVLADLARRGYFTIERGSDTYEYHPLFREFLLARGRETLSPERRAVVLRTAARLLEEEGDPASAVALLGEARAWDELARVAVANAPALLAQGRAGPLGAWLEALPEEVKDAVPWSRYWLGLARLAASPAEARIHLESAWQRFVELGDARGQYLTWAAMVDTFVCEWADFGPLDRWIDALDGLRLRHPSQLDSDVEGRVITAALGALVFRRPDHPTLPEWEERATAFALGDAPLAVRLPVGTYLLVYQAWWKGDVHRATRLVRALAPAARGGTVEPLRVIMWRSAEAPYHWNRGEREAADEATRDGLALAAETGVHLWDFMLHLQSVWAAVAGDDPPAARRHLAAMEAELHPAHRFNASTATAARAALELRTGDPLAALEHALSGIDQARRGGMPFARLLGHLAAARALDLLGRRGEAGDHVAQARDLGLHARSAYAEYACGLIEAFSALRAGERLRAGEAVRRAFAVGRESGLVDHVWFTREETGALCALALEEGLEVEYARELACARRARPPEGSLDVEGWPWDVEVRMLGGLFVLRDGRPLPLSWRAHRKPLQLLALLVVLGGADIAEERVAAVLWPEAEGDAAHHALETALYRLRKLLHCEGALVHGGHLLSVDRRLVWIDAWVVERALGRALALLERRVDQAHPDLVASCGQITRLYGGAFLRGEAGPAWCLAHREKLRTRVQRFVAARAQQLRAARQDGEAAALERWASERVPFLQRTIPAAVRGDPSGVPLW